MPRDIFKLLDALRAGTTQAAFPSLAGLPFAIQKMTIAGAAIKLNGRSIHCANLRRLVFGQEPRTILEVAQALNRAASSPVTDQQLAALPFERGFIVWATAWSRDFSEGLTGQAHAGSKGGAKGDAPGDDRVVSTPDSAINDVVKQLYIGFHAGDIGRDVFPPRGAPEAGKRWQVNTQARLDALLFELGDHTPPPPPALDPVKSPTNQNPITLTGRSEPGATIFVSGGAQPAVAIVDASGSFAATVQLLPNAENTLTLVAQDPAGNVSSPVAVTVRHDDVAPLVAITAPAQGTFTERIVIAVTGTASDEFSLKEVRVNAAAVTVAGGAFTTSVTLAVGSNLIRAEAEDAAGNLAVADVTVMHQRPPAFGTVGPSGGTVAVTSPGPLFGASLTVKPGALATPKLLWLRQPNEFPALPDGAIAVGHAVAFEPEGTAFAVPATITVPYDPRLLAAVRAKVAEVRLYGFEVSQTAFSPVSGATAGTQTVTTQVSHFTIFQAGAVPADVRVQTWVGNGAVGAVNTSVPPWQSPLPQPHFTAATPDGHFVLVSTYDGTNTRLFELDVAAKTLRERPFPLGLRAMGVAIQADRTALVAAVDQRVWSVNRFGVIKVIAGGGSIDLTLLGAPATVLAVQARLRDVLGLALDPATGDVFIAATNFYRLRQGMLSFVGPVTFLTVATSPVTQRVTPGVSPGVAGHLGSGCLTPLAGLTTPIHFVVSGAVLQSNAQVLYLADPRKNNVTAFNVGTSTATLFPQPGSGATTLALAPGDGAVVLTGIVDPHGLAVDTDGNVYVAEQEQHRIRLLSGKSGYATTLAGRAAVCGFDADGNGPTATALGYPGGLAVLPTGDLLVADTGNVRLRLLYDQDLDDDTVLNHDGLRTAGLDNCPGTANLTQVDGDRDGVGDACDRCPADPFNDQDLDGLCGDVDLDDDGDNVFEDGNTSGNFDAPCALGVTSACDDNCPLVANRTQADADFDGFGDACDNCPSVLNQSQDDQDRDGKGYLISELGSRA